MLSVSLQLVCPLRTVHLPTLSPALARWIRCHTKHSSGQDFSNAKIMEGTAPHHPFDRVCCVNALDTGTDGPSHPGCCVPVGAPGHAQTLSGGSNCYTVFSLNWFYLYSFLQTSISKQALKRGRGNSATVAVFLENPWPQCWASGNLKKVKCGFKQICVKSLTKIGGK